MIIRNWPIGKVASLRDAPDVMTIRNRTALRKILRFSIESPQDFLHSVINIKPLRGFFTANADNHNWFNICGLHLYRCGSLFAIAINF